MPDVTVMCDLHKRVRVHDHASFHLFAELRIVKMPIIFHQLPMQYFQNMFLDRLSFDS